MKYHYTYYSYEEWGRGYIGKRSCKCKPEEDVRYFGSYRDKTFKPTHKIILETYATSEEALDAEIKLQRFFKVVENSHFVNRAYQTSTKFYIDGEEAIKRGKKRKEQLAAERFYNSENQSVRGKKGGNYIKEFSLGIFSLTTEEISLNGKKGGLKNKENKSGICGITKEQRSETTKKTNAQRWQCTETKFITNAGCLSHYQKARGIDTSKRIRIN